MSQPVQQNQSTQPIHGQPIQGSTQTPPTPQNTQSQSSIAPESWGGMITRYAKTVFVDWPYAVGRTILWIVSFGYLCRDEETPAGNATANGGAGNTANVQDPATGASPARKKLEAVHAKAKEKDDAEAEVKRLIKEALQEKEIQAKVKVIYVKKKVKNLEKAIQNDEDARKPYVENFEKEFDKALKQDGDLDSTLAESFLEFNPSTSTTPEKAEDGKG